LRTHSERFVDNGLNRPRTSGCGGEDTSRR